MNKDSQWCKQEYCFTRATRVWLAVNHNTSVTSGAASELGSCQSFFVFHEAMNGCKNLKIH